MMGVEAATYEVLAGGPNGTEHNRRVSGPGTPAQRTLSVTSMLPRVALL